MDPEDTWRSLATGISCTCCGAHLPLDQAHNLCVCGGPLAVRYDLERAAPGMRRPTLLAIGEGIWGFRDLLPVQSAAGCVNLGEGGTPLLLLPRLGARLGSASLWVKDESLNPTNSFKARGMAVAVSRSREMGLDHLAIPSAGNAGSALASYAASA
jgi:threonine synthase